MKKFRYLALIQLKWTCRSRGCLNIVLCALVWYCSGDEAAASEPNCPSPRLVVAQRGTPAADEELWSNLDLLAYDLVTRTSVDRLYQESELKELQLSLADALQRLNAKFPETSVTPSLEYKKLALQVTFAPRIQDDLEARVPRRSTAVTLVNLPGPFPEEVSRFCEQLCECWVQVDSQTTVRMYFPKSVNLLYAIRRLRTFPGVSSAGLIKSALPAPTRQPSNWQNLSVRKVAGDYFFTLTASRPEHGTEKKFYVVSTSKVRRLGTSEAVKMSEFQSFPLPSDAFP